MGSDKDIEDQIPEEGAFDDFEEENADFGTGESSESFDDMSEDGTFSEEESFMEGEEEFAEDEEWDAYDEDFVEEGEESAQPKKKKKFGMFEIGVIGGAVVLGGVVMVMQMGGGQPAGTSAQPTQVQQAASSQDNQSLQQLAQKAPKKTAETQREMVYGVNLDDDDLGKKKTGGDAPQKGFMTDSTIAEKVGEQAEDAFYNDDDLTYDDAGRAQVSDGNTTHIQEKYEEELANEEAKDSQVTVVNGTPPMPAPITTDSKTEEPLTPMPSMEDAPKPANADSGSVSFSGGFEEDVPRGPTDKVDDTDMTEATPPVMPKASDMMKKTDSFSEPVSMPEKNVATATVSGSDKSMVSDDQLSALNGRLDKIFDRLDSMDFEIDSLKDQAGAGADSAMLKNLQKSVKALEEKVDKLSKTQKTASVSKPQASPPRTYSSSTSSASSVKKSTANVSSSSKTATKWVLKAAQPGKAWVVREGGDDMLAVSVGDSLTGIGQIKSVEYADNQWVVQGTKGKITQ